MKITMEDLWKVLKSYSTYVVLFFTSLPEMWNAIPVQYKEQLFLALPYLRGLEAYIYIATFALAFVKARAIQQSWSVPQNPPQP